MTDRVRTLTVVLVDDMRTDDVERVVDAIKLLGPVDDVVIGPIVDVNDHLVRREFRMKLWQDLTNMLDGGRPRR